MTINSLIDLDSLPAPDVVEDLSFEVLLGQKLETLIGIDPEFSALVESDPAIKLLEADSYNELVLRQRINDAARARLLAFATGSNLDQLAVYYGVSRLSGESDIAFKTRIRAAIMGRSAAGTAAQYRYAALSASVEVADVSVDSPIGGVVRVSVLSTVGTGAPSPELLADVTAIVAADDVRALCHTVLVVAAEVVTVNVTGQVWLTPNAPEDVFNSLEQTLRDAHAEARGLGFNIAPSWLISKMQISGVQRVTLSAPASQVAISSNQCSELGTINLTLAGRDY